MGDFYPVQKLKRLCLPWGWRFCQLSPSPLMLARPLRAVCLSVIVTLVMLLAWQAVFRSRPAGMFLRLACPDSSRRSSSDTSTTGIHDAVATLHHMHQALSANWSFKAPHHVASACPSKASDASKLLLVLIPVTLTMTAERQAIRRTWGSDLNPRFGQLLFLIQLSPDEPADSKLTAELVQHQDLLLAFCSDKDHQDSYQLLVLKVAAGLRWYSLECRMAFNFVLKADHDSYWNVASLLRILQRQRPSEALVLGSIQEGALANRDSSSKFFTPVEVYSRHDFPTYASGGPGYVLSRSAAVMITELATSTSCEAISLWLEDVFLTGLLPEAAFSSCANGSAGSSEKGLAASGRFLHLHSDFIYLCPYSEFTPEVAHRWPPLAMHRVEGRALFKLHALMQALGVQNQSEKLHRQIYRRSLRQRS